MKQTLTEWRERLLNKLMAALDAAWDQIETSDDPALVRKARDRAKACAACRRQANACFREDSQCFDSEREIS